MTEKAYETILVERDGRVGTITLNRPKALNALNSQVMHEVITAAAEFDNDPGIGAIIITGSAKAFAAGADIKEMSQLAHTPSLGDVPVPVNSTTPTSGDIRAWSKTRYISSTVCGRNALRTSGRLNATRAVASLTWW